MERKKSQAALEFLVTYGWALLMIMITIAALIYFGISRPADVLPNRCIFSPEITCIDYQISSDFLKLKLKSNIPGAIDVSAIALNVESAVPYNCTNAPSNPASWNQGSIIELAWSGCSGGAVVSGGKAKIGIKIDYASAGSSYINQANGEVYSRVP